MSVKYSLLALLNDRPAYGYQLRSQFQERTGETWPLNIGQVYTTLERLERDGLVRQDGQDDEGKKMYSITEAGRAEITDWFSEPIKPDAPPRNELAIKIALASSTHGADALNVVHQQRTATLSALQKLTRTKREMPAPSTSVEVAAALVLESNIFSLESEIRWLDHSESMIHLAQRNAR